MSRLREPRRARVDALGSRKALVGGRVGAPPVSVGRNPDAPALGALRDQRGGSALVAQTHPTCVPVVAKTTNYAFTIAAIVMTTMSPHLARAS
jgi:hypothetical protein